ncbi:MULTISPECIES: cryptochrome/photolyase family protein [Hyphobacterium]|uniref:Cryptochrome/photolyase family protein n=1 Tax=Hyphobacterium vulgare TaxID=1736751 RepID=A0ABV6ZTA1_9PROT
MSPSASTSPGPVIVWFRQDLRLCDNPALHQAVDSGQPVIPVFILDDDTPGRWRWGGASRWWLHHSLTALAASLETCGVHLVLRSGRSDTVIAELVEETGASAVFWNRCYEPFARTRDEAIKSALKDKGVDVASFNGALLAEPWTIRTRAGDPYRVFTPFWRAEREVIDPADPLPAPKSLKPWKSIASDDLADWALTPSRPDWANGFTQVWTPGESGARARLASFLDERLASYADGRDRPDRDDTSGLSPHLHWGEVSPRQVWHATRRAAEGRNADKFLSEVGWREFSYNLLFHFPHFPDRNYQDRFDAFPWADNEAGFSAWTRGMTGYPIVDAGMRQLWQTGSMHNRVRMITASFLIKDLMIDWRRGQDWFWDTLVDADLANNSASWQWVAGSGADAAPYFRIFNPVTQGEKFDPDGKYVKRFVPELAKLPVKYIHAPWTAPESVLAQAGIRLGTTYPEPIIDHSEARDRALAAFKGLKEAA